MVIHEHFSMSADQHAEGFFGIRKIWQPTKVKRARRSCRARSRASPMGRRRSLVEDLDVNIVDAGVGQPDLLGSGLGEIQIPTTRVRPTVRDLDDHGVAPVGYQQLRTE